MAGRVIAMVLISAAGFGQTTLKPEAVLLSRIRVRAAENLRRMPNYTCRETIERSLRQPPTNRFHMVDTVRLEVALVKGKELFGWPGAEKFEEGDIGDMVKGGAIGNGNFANHARSIFLGAGPQFTYGGETDLEGRKAIRYDFKVAQNQSRYLLRIGTESAIAAYYGSFWVEPGSLDLIRLEVTAVDIPPNLPMRSATDKMDYSRVKIGESDFLLPKSSLMTLTDSLGNENRNRTVFTNCREYGTESVISYTDPSPVMLPSIEPAKPLGPIVLPEGLMILSFLETEILGERSAVGDELVAIVSSNVKRGKQILIPKGAKLSGRLTQLQRQGGDYLFNFTFNRIEFGGRQGRFASTLLELGAVDPRSPPGVKVSRYLSTEFRIVLGKNGKQSDPAMVYVRGSRLQLAKGLRIVLRTELVR